MEIKVGDQVQCINGRFIGSVGIVDMIDPDKYGRFCMTVFPSVGERVNPSNWLIIDNVKVETPKRMIWT